TEALATELRLKQGFNNARIVNIMNCRCIKKAKLIYNSPINQCRWFELITWSQLKLCKNQFKRDRKPRWFIALENYLMGDRRNRKLAPEYIISGYNSLALSIVLPAVSLDKRKKELVLVKNKDNDRKIFKITQKDKAKILDEHYCNIPLADPTQFEIKKYKGYSRNIAKMTKKINEGVCTSHFSWNKILGTLPRSYIKEGKRILNWNKKRTFKKFKSKLLTNSLNESLF
ncbi:45176_t:CDS:2, partial [Gigaspora margarita]